MGVGYSNVFGTIDSIPPQRSESHLNGSWIDSAGLRNPQLSPWRAAICLGCCPTGTQLRNLRKDLYSRFYSDFLLYPNLKFHVNI